MKCKRDPQIRVNICWQVGEEKKCATLSKEQAYATRDWVKQQDGIVMWFNPVQ